MKHERSDEARPASGRVLLIDPSVRGQSHILINTGFIEIVSNLYQDVTVVAHESHVSALRQYMNRAISGEVNFVEYEESSDIIKIYKSYIDNDDTSPVIFLNIEHAAYQKVNLSNILRARNDIFWVAHSHFLTFGEPGLKIKIKNVFKRASFFNPAYRSKIIVCGKKISANLNHLLHEEEKIRSVFHPIGIDPLPFDEMANKKAESKLSLLHINGWHEPSAIKVATIESIKSIARNGKFLFEDIKSGVSKDQGERRFLRDYHERLKMISESSYFVHLPEDPYRLQASGALMDLLLTRTPVIGLKTDFGKELKEIIGKFGYFFDDHDAMTDFLRTVDPATLLAERAAFVCNLERGYDTVKRVSLQDAKAALRAA